MDIVLDIIVSVIVPGFFVAIFALPLLYIFVYLPSVLIRRHRIRRQLRSVTGPEFHPSVHVHRGKVGVAIDVVRRRFAVATPATSVLLEAMDVTDIRLHDQGGTEIIDIDLRSTVVPTVRFATSFSSDRLRAVVSLLKSFHKDTAREDVAGERNPPRQESPAPAFSAPGLEQELAALRREVSKLAAVLTSLRDAGPRAGSQD